MPSARYDVIEFIGGPYDVRTMPLTSFSVNDLEPRLRLPFPAGDSASPLRLMSRRAIAVYKLTYSRGFWRYLYETREPPTRGKLPVWVKSMIGQLRKLGPNT